MDFSSEVTFSASTDSFLIVCTITKQQDYNLSKSCFQSPEILSLPNTYN